MSARGGPDGAEAAFAMPKDMLIMAINMAMTNFVFRFNLILLG